MSNSDNANNVINLNRFRKKKQREDKEKTAGINRAKHGRKREEKRRDSETQERQHQHVDGHKLTPAPSGDDEPA